MLETFIGTRMVGAEMSHLISGPAATGSGVTLVGMITAWPFKLWGKRFKQVNGIINHNNYSLKKSMVITITKTNTAGYTNVSYMRDQCVMA